MLKNCHLVTVLTVCNGDHVSLELVDADDSDEDNGDADDGAQDDGAEADGDDGDIDEDAGDETSAGSKGSDVVDDDGDEDTWFDSANYNYWCSYMSLEDDHDNDEIFASWSEMLENAEFLWNVVFLEMFENVVLWMLENC